MSIQVMEDFNVHYLRLRYIGRDGLDSLHEYQIYNCSVFTQDGYIWVGWMYGLGSSRVGLKSYSSIREMLENWEEVE